MDLQALISDGSCLPQDFQPQVAPALGLEGNLGLLVNRVCSRRPTRGDFLQSQAEPSSPLRQPAGGTSGQQTQWHSRFRPEATFQGHISGSVTRMKRQAEGVVGKAGGEVFSHSSLSMPNRASCRLRQRCEVRMGLSKDPLAYPRVPMGSRVQRLHR